MSIPTISFFNNKGGVGKTSLVYHLAWMYADLGLPVLAADLDPQSNLSAALLYEDEFERIWPETGERETISGYLEPLKRGVGDIVADPEPKAIADDLTLLPGDLRLSELEDELSDTWTKCLDRNERAFRVMSAFWRLTQAAARRSGARLVLVDLGPNLGAINRAAMVASDHVVIPVAPDLFSVQGLRNLGPTLVKWRNSWEERRERNPGTGFDIPEGDMRPAGYVVLQHAVRLDRPVRAYEKWIRRIPGTYRDAVLDEPLEAGADAVPQVTDDPHCLSLMKHYRSLMPMAQEARKPIFHLRPADGAIGGHSAGVEQARLDFDRLARAVLDAVGLRHDPEEPRPT